MTRGRRAVALACLSLAASGRMGSAAPATEPPSATEPPPAAGPAPGHAPAPIGPHLTLAAGVVEIIDPEPRALFSIAWQDRRGARRASPWLAVEGTSRDRFFGFGALVDFPAGARCLLTPSLGVALYQENDGLGLGSILELRSAIDVTWPLGRGRIGATLLHYSNAGIGGDTNPGTEALLLIWMAPIGRR